jgi:cytosine/adenosine deaminase-related metal-dependent hydrolase
MIEAGVNVALGTDGLSCLDRADRMSVLDDMRLLHRRDDADPVVLLRMATTAGAVGLDLDPDLVTLAPGPVAGLIALPFDPADTRDPFVQVLQRDDAPEWVAR